jgi:FMN phosphatase YigB (HAD superfamily)
MLRALTGRYLLGTVTNGIDRVQRARLRASHLEGFFDSVVTSEACGYAKPDPRIVHCALEALGVAAEEAILVGDDPDSDGRAAAQAGVRFCWVDDGRPLRAGLRPPRLRITDLSRLSALLEARR